MADDEGRTAVEQDPEGRAARLPEGNQQNPSAPPAEGATDTTDWKAEARKWERQAKSNAEAAKTLAAVEESQKTEQQKLADRVAAAEKRAAKAELKVLRVEVASAKSIPASLAQRLQGSTREELEADAEDLLKTIPAQSTQGKPKTPPAAAVAGAGGAPQGGTPEDIFAALIKGG